MNRCDPRDGHPIGFAIVLITSHTVEVCSLGVSNLSIISVGIHAIKKHQKSSQTHVDQIARHSTAVASLTKAREVHREFSLHKTTTHTVLLCSLKLNIRATFSSWLRKQCGKQEQLPKVCHDSSKISGYIRMPFRKPMTSVQSAPDMIPPMGPTVMTRLT